MREWIGRVGLLVAGLLVSVLLLEVMLQTGALVARSVGRDSEGPGGTVGRRILCLGDSNTYGLWVEREQAYPQQLEALWNAASSTAPVEVINLGYPGTNSSRLALQLPRMLEALRPDDLMVMVGVNDFWTAPLRADPGARETSDPWQWLRANSRTWRLYALLRHRFRDPEGRILPDLGIDREVGEIGLARIGDQEFELGYMRAAEPGDADGESLAQNLETIVAVASEAGVQPVLMTYPSTETWYQLASAALRQVAQETGARLIDLERAFAPHCPDGKCLDLIFENNHPTARGYTLVAETILGELAPRGSP